VKSEALRPLGSVPKGVQVMVLYVLPMMSMEGVLRSVFYAIFVYSKSEGGEYLLVVSLLVFFAFAWGRARPRSTIYGKTHGDVDPCGGGGNADTNQTMKLHS
jgi:hypothetical protein